MDLAYNQHDHSSGRRKFHSAGNLNHLSLAALTSRLPIHDHRDDYYSHDATASPLPHTTYLQGKSAPTTPRLLSRSPPRRSASASSSSARRNARLPKSKSATHLDPRARGRSAAHAAAAARNAATAVTSPVTASSRRSHPHHNHNRSHSHHQHQHPHHHNGGAGSYFAPTASDYSDWLLRAGALISSEARESKGQSWLASRASSTSLAGDGGGGGGSSAAGNGYYDGEAASSLRYATAGGSRRNSSGGMYLGAFGDDSAAASPVQSRFSSRSHSRVGSRSVLVLTPAEREQQRFAMAGGEDYFGGVVSVEEEEEEEESMISGPDFVNLNEKLEHADIEVDTSAEDEAYVRRLVKRGNGGVGAWLGNVFGLRLFSVEEDEEEESGGDDGETTDGEADEDAASQDMDTRSASMRRLEAITTAVDPRIPPPKPDEGGWHDAAWLLTVASKVLL